VAEGDWLTYEMFRDRVGERFHVAVGDQAVELELAEATESTEAGGPGPDGQERQQFSLVFRGPASAVLQQGTYQVTNAGMGELDLFLVPLGPDGDSMQYEAAFA
jgi:hypothetical protein